MALPRLTGMLQLHIHPRTGRNWPPSVLATGFKVDAKIEQLLGVNAHGALDAPGKGYADFVDVNAQSLTVPMQLTRPDIESVSTAIAMRCSPLSHGPAVGLPAVERDIQTAMIFGIRVRATATSPCIVR